MSTTPTYDGLLGRERAFVDEYFFCGLNGSEACRRLHYKKPWQQSSTFLKMGSIRTAIEERLKERKLGADEVLGRIGEKCAPDMADFLKVSDDGTSSIDLQKAKKRGKLHLIKRLKIGKHGRIEGIELHDPLRALELLARVHHLLTPKDEHGGNDADNVDLEWDDA